MLCSEFRLHSASGKGAVTIKAAWAGYRDKTKHHQGLRHILEHGTAAAPSVALNGRIRTRAKRKSTSWGLLLEEEEDIRVRRLLVEGVISW